MSHLLFITDISLLTSFCSDHPARFSTFLVKAAQNVDKSLSHPHRPQLTRRSRRRRRSDCQPYPLSCCANRDARSRLWDIPLSKQRDGFHARSPPLNIPWRRACRRCQLEHPRLWLGQQWEWEQQRRGKQHRKSRMVSGGTRLRRLSKRVRERRRARKQWRRQRRARPDIYAPVPVPWHSEDCSRVDDVLVCAVFLSSV